MNHEPIPGLANKIRDTLKRRVDDRFFDCAAGLSDDDIYAQAPSDEIDRIVRLRPTDNSDIRQWLAFRDEADRQLTTKAINEWIKNLMREHGMFARGRRAA